MEANKIIITGGATRIGAAIAKRLAGRGVEIVIHFNKSKSNAEKLKKELSKKQTKVYLIPEDETRDSHTYHYTAIKTRKFTLENKKMRLKKFNPVKRIHEWFVEAKLPPHN